MHNKSRTRKVQTKRHTSTDFGFLHHTGLEVLLPEFLQTSRLQSARLCHDTCTVHLTAPATNAQEIPPLKLHTSNVVPMRLRLLGPIQQKGERLPAVVGTTL